MSTTNVDFNTNASSIKDILNAMSSKDGNIHPSMVNPFLDPNFSTKSVMGEEEVKGIHRGIKLAAKQTLYEELAEDLRQNSGYGDYDACKMAVDRDDFKEFCDLKDENGFTAIKYAGDLGYHKIVKLLLDAGAKSYQPGLKDFININVDQNDIGMLQSLNPIKEGEDEDNEIEDKIYKMSDLKPTPSILPLPTTKDEKEKMMRRLNNLETSLSNKNVNFSLFDKLEQSDKLRPDIESKNDDSFNIDSIKRFTGGDGFTARQTSPDAIPYTNKTAVSSEKSSNKKKETSFGAAFKKNLAKNFSKTGFSDDRHVDKFVPPGRTEVTPEQIQDMMINMNLERFQGKSNEFLEEFSGRDVSKYMMNSEKIQPMLKLNRATMLPASPIRSDLLESITSSLKNQNHVLNKSAIDSITDSVFETIKFYIDMYHRMMDLGRVEVRSSPIHGNGVFATRKIKRGDVVTFYFPYFLNYNYADPNDKDREKTADIVVPVLSRRKIKGDKDFNDLFKSTIKIPDNFFLMGDNEFISDSRFLGHMINDPCDFSKGHVDEEKYERELLNKANASVVSYTNDRRYIYVGAMRDIEIGEEILVPYGGRFWEIEPKIVSVI